MIDPALSTDAPVVDRAHRRPYRDWTPASGRSDESLPLDGVVDGSSGDRLRAIAQRWRATRPITPFAATAHVDLSEVVQLDPSGVKLLNEMYRQVHASGWAFRITPPANLDARLTFLRAVVDGQLDWA